MHCSSSMTALTVRSLIGLTEAELDRLRLAYLEIAGSRGPSNRRMLAEYLAQRETQTIEALRRYREFDSEVTALDVHIRLGWAFPIIGLPKLGKGATIAAMFDCAEHSDARLGQLRERVELYASGAQLSSMLAAIDCIVESRRRDLVAVQHELDIKPPLATTSRPATPPPSRLTIDNG